LRVDKYSLYMYNLRMKHSGEDEKPESGFLLNSFGHAGRMVENRLDNALADHGLSIAKFGVLKTLAQAGEPLPLGQIADRLACVRSNITQLIDRMEAEGLVKRSPDPEDRRSIRASLTEEGDRRYAAGVEEESRVERELFGGLLPEEQEQLQDILWRFLKNSSPTV
jgi:DNA-binding MarR family transcriptional regulator